MTAARVLVVDDEPDIRNLVSEILQDEGYAVDVAGNAAEARQARRKHPDLVLLDVWMPDTDGISLLREWSAEGGLDCPVIMISGHGTIETAVEATRLGAYDFVEKPITLAKLLLMVERALETGRLKRQNAGLRRQLAMPVDPQGGSEAMRGLRAQLEHLAANDVPVLIRGEPGTGKENLARWLHARSQRADGPFVALAAAGLDREHAHGSLFGGSGDDGEFRPGLLEQAQGGSLFIDEICALDADLQQRLATVLEQQGFTRPGSHEPVQLELRMIAASAEDLEARVKEAALPEALYYQLNVAPVQVPPLRERSEDVPQLLRHYAEFYASRDHLQYREFPVAVQNRLRQYSWPGNLRELRALVQRLLVLGSGDAVDLAEVDAALRHTPAQRGGEALAAIDFALPLREAREQFEREYLSRQLDAAQGSVGRMAKHVGMERTHLYRKLRDLGIELKSRDER